MVTKKNQSRSYLNHLVYPSFYEPGELCKEGRKSAFHVMCPSSGKVDIENVCSSKDCGIGDGNELLSNCNSIACSSEDHTVCDVEGQCSVNVLSATAADRDGCGPSCRQ